MGGAFGRGDNTMLTLCQGHSPNAVTMLPSEFNLLIQCGQFLTTDTRSYLSTNRRSIDIRDTLRVSGGDDA